MGKVFKGFAIGCGGLIGLIVVVAVIAAAVGGDGGSDGATAGNGSTEAPPAEKENEAALAAGESATAEGLRITLLEIVDPFVSSNMFSTPSAGNRFVAFKVLVENVSDENQYVNSFDFTLTDAENYQHEPAIGVVFDGQSLAEAPSALTGGGKFEGWVGFEVKEGIGLKDLMYDPNPFTKTDHHFRAP